MPHNLPSRPDPGFAPQMARLAEAFAGQDWALNYIAQQSARCLDDARRIAGLAPGGRVLNIGGAPYVFDVLARDLGHAVHAWDIDPERNRAAIASLGLSVSAVDVEAPGPLPDLSGHDVVCLAEVLEHLRIDLVGTLRRIRDGMDDDALFYVTTPNFHFAPRFWRMLVQGRSGPSLVEEWRKLGELGHMGHVREYSRRELVELFAFCGFRVERMIARNGNGLVGRGFGPAAFARALARRCDGLAQDFVFLLRKA